MVGHVGSVQPVHGLADDFGDAMGLVVGTAIAAQRGQPSVFLQRQRSSDGVHAMAGHCSWGLPPP